MDRRGLHHDLQAFEPLTFLAVATHGSCLSDVGMKQLLGRCAFRTVYANGGQCRPNGHCDQKKDDCRTENPGSGISATPTPGFLETADRARIDRFVPQEPAEFVPKGL